MLEANVCFCDPSLSCLSYISCGILLIKFLDYFIGMGLQQHYCCLSCMMPGYVTVLVVQAGELLTLELYGEATPIWTLILLQTHKKSRAEQEEPML